MTNIKAIILVYFLWNESISMCMKFYSSLISGFFSVYFFLGVSLWKEIGVPVVTVFVSVSVSLSLIISVFFFTF